MQGTVLIIDDSPQLAQRVATTLVREGLFARALTALTGLEGYQLLRQNDVQVIVCDVMLPDIDGFKFLALKNEHPELGHIPVIMLTGEHDIASKVQGLTLGAADYITKPFHDTELVARVRVHLTLKTLQDELRNKNKRLDDLARIDELTQVANRRALMQALNLEFLRAARYNTTFGILMCDVDHFKAVNDTYGHVIGDRVLQMVARALSETLRVHDTVGRYGGEEFVIILPHASTEGVQQVAERIRHHVQETPVTLENGKVVGVTISVGTLCFPHPGIENVEILLQSADNALYQAKRDGRNRVVSFTTP